MSDNVKVVLRHCLGYWVGKYSEAVSGLKLTDYPLCDGNTTDRAQIFIAL